MRARVLTMTLALAGCGSVPRDASRPRIDPPVASPAPPTTSAPDDLQARYADRVGLEARRGRASYYADRFEGRSTASGEPYDPRAFTAASRDLPFGTVVRVTREDTGAAVVVRVNDRGPFRDRRRIIDLSGAAADALAMRQAGVVDVRVEVLERPAR